MYYIVDKIIYFYIFICVALLLFNIIYIFRSEAVGRRQKHRDARWRNEIMKAWGIYGGAQTLGKDHHDLLIRRLTRVEELTAWNNVLFGSDPLLEDADKKHYLELCGPALLVLAWKYKSHNTMERAFFAYIVQAWASGCQKGREGFLAPMLAYLEDSSVYCRENVLRALYTLGNPEAIAKAFDYISSQHWYHHPKLISDGLWDFCTTDREVMADYLWNRCHQWPENFGVAVVLFATRVSDALSDSFYTALIDVKTPLELRFSLLRFFRRHRDDRARQFLLELMENDDTSSSGLKIVAASVLAAYPGKETKDALIRALSSRNWYVRQNAALSLKELVMTPEDMQQIYRSNDKYAIDMIRYIVKEKEQGVSM